mmetsp:Transcript_53735/g.64818  ORF Transcript_53735/g.64818 Transcript_53735/m.64818 type:complete len:102 (+) Transcript_53735:189-494(+)
MPMVHEETEEEEGGEEEGRLKVVVVVARSSLKSREDNSSSSPVVLTVHGLSVPTVEGWTPLFPGPGNMILLALFVDGRDVVLYWYYIILWPIVRVVRSIIR